MTVSYNKLWEIIKDRNMMKMDLLRASGISTNALAKLGKNEDVRFGVLVKICSALNVHVDDIVDYGMDEKNINGGI